MGVKVKQKKPGKGNPWWVFVYHNGKRMSRSVGSKKAAQAVAMKIEASLGNGSFGLDKPKAQPTFGECAVKWLNFVEAQLKGDNPKYRQSTLDEHVCVLRKHLLPEFKDRRLDSITKGNTRDFLVGKLKDLSKGRVVNIKGVMSNVYNLAIEDEIVSTNPTLGISLFQSNGKIKTVEKTEVFTKDELNLLLDTCEKHFPEYRVFFLMASRTGLRLGELLALEWDDIDFNSRYVYVQRSYRRGRTTKTKTDKTRQTDLSDQLLGELRVHLTKQKKKAMSEGSGEVSGLVFDYGKLDREKFIRRTYRRILKKAGLRYVKFHGLRHAFCAHLLSKGISPYYVSQQAGHSSITITCDIYGSWIRSEGNRHVNTLDSEHHLDPPAHLNNNQNSQQPNNINKYS
jgi:integrase